MTKSYPFLPKIYPATPEAQKRKNDKRKQNSIMLKALKAKTPEKPKTPRTDWPLHFGRFEDDDRAVRNMHGGRLVRMG